MSRFDSRFDHRKSLSLDMPDHYVNLSVGRESPSKLFERFKGIKSKKFSTPQKLPPNAIKPPRPIRKSLNAHK